MNTSEMSNTNVSNRQSKQRRVRWWIPALIVALAAASLLRLRLSTDVEENFKSMQRFMTIGLGTLLLIIWLMLLSGLRWRTRLAALGVVVLLIAGLTQLVRFDGTADATGRFNVVWKWTPQKDGNVGEFKPTLLTNAAATKTAFDFPGFLGSDRRGVVAGIQLEQDWNGHPPSMLWRQPIGLGWSSFAVAGSRAITQEQRGENEMVVCYNLADGGIVWAHTNLVRFSEFMGGDGPRATPTIDNGRVYALGATGILDCLEASTGKLLWSRDTLKENSLPNLQWAKSSSPLVTEKLVVVTGGLTNGPTLLGYDRESGAPAWRAGFDKASYSSPTLATLCGEELIVSVNAGSVTAHEPTDGRTVWVYLWPSERWAKCAQPLVLDGDRILVSAGYGAGCVLLQVKRDSNGQFAVAEVWKNRNMKSQFSNLVVRDGFVYGLDDGILACVDLATGERKWKDGRYGHGQVLLAGDVLLVQTEPGPVVLVDANPSIYREVARLAALSSKTWNVPGLAGDFLLVRNDQEAACYRLPLRLSIQTAGN